MTSAEVATTLGFDASLKFVRVTGGRVSFSAGKPDEVRELAYRAIRRGYLITDRLRAAAGMSVERVSDIRECYGICPRSV